MQLYSGNRIGRRGPEAEKITDEDMEENKMSDNAWLALGLFVIVMVAAWALTRKARCSEKFDEMQLKIRARGYQIGFFTALGLMMVLAFLLETGCVTIMSPGLLALTALMISVTVFAIYCITHEAFLSIRGDGKNHIARKTLRLTASRRLLSSAMATIKESTTMSAVEPKANSSVA